MDNRVDVRQLGVRYRRSHFDKTGKTRQPPMPKRGIPTPGFWQQVVRALLNLLWQFIIGRSTYMKTSSKPNFGEGNKKVLRLICWHEAQFGKPPPQKTMARQLGLHVTTVKHHMSVLSIAGCVRRIGDAPNAVYGSTHLGRYVVGFPVLTKYEQRREEKEWQDNETKIPIMEAVNIPRRFSAS